MPVGQPTKYKPEYCEAIVKFFDIKPYEIVPVTRIDKKGGETFTNEERPNDFPTLAGFAAEIGVSRDSLYVWAHEKDAGGEPKHPEFSYAYKRAKDFQEKILVTNGIRGLYNPAFAIFTAKNVLGWRDKQEVDHTTAGEKINVSIVDFAKLNGHNPSV